MKFSFVGSLTAFFIYSTAFGTTLAMKSGVLNNDSREEIPASCQARSFVKSAYAEYFQPSSLNCEKASRIARQAALYACYEEGYMSCDLVDSYITSNSESRCEVKAVARSTSESCNIKGLFTAGAYAQYYESSDINCQRARNLAWSLAKDKCYGAGFSNCQKLAFYTKNQTENYCEVEAIVRGL